MPNIMTATGRDGSSQSACAAALACWPSWCEGPKVATERRRARRCRCLGGRLGPRSLQENVVEDVGIGRSSPSEHTTATLPSIPPRCSRLHTQPPSSPTSIGCSAFPADGPSEAGEEHARYASSCWYAARCLPPRLASLRISSALIWAPLSRFSTALAARYGHEHPASPAA